MAIFVLIHGGVHGGWCYQRVARLLQAQGHVVYAPSLPGMGEHTHMRLTGINLDMHIDDVVNLLHMEDLRDAIIVGHSYGGMVITGVADRATDRVGHRVYLDAAYPENFQSLADHAPMIQAGRAVGETIDGIELILPGQLGFFGVTEPATIEWMKTRLTPNPWACFEQKLILRNEAAMRAIPESHIVCADTAPSRDMELFRARAEGRVWEIDTGHDIMLTEPAWLAARLGDIAAAHKKAKTA